VIGAKRVTAPDGTTWHVGRRWLPDKPTLWRRSTYHYAARPGGGTGLRDGLKIHCPKGLAGSNPAPGMQPVRAGGGMCRVGRHADRRRAVARLAMLALAIAAAFALVTLAGISHGEAQRWVEQAGLAGPVVFVLAGGALGLALFPGHVTATVAGMLFGAVAGTALALAATLLGAALCLLAARRLGADATLKLLGPRGRRRRAWLEANGFSAVLAARLAPGMPSGAVNYLAGLAGIRPRAFYAAVALGALPKTIAYVTLGGALEDPLSPRGAFAAALYAAAAAGGALVARRLIRNRPAPAPV
jgi:uncharacterized membrane protein YdjX (TVP38/TMEM64 family)